MASYEEIEMLQGIEACNYSAMAAMAWTLHEVVVLFPREYEEMWLKPWSNLKLLFYFLRVVNISTQILSNALTLRFAAGYEPTIRGCKVLIGFQGTAGAALVFATQIILLLRVEALYYERILLRRLLRVLLIAEVILMIVVLTLTIPRITYGLQCVTLTFPYIAAVFYGIWAFALPFTVLVVNAGCTVILSGPKSSIAYPWMTAVPGFAGCRLILNLSHLLKTARPSNTFDSRGSALIDTVIETHQDPTGEITTYELGRWATHNGLQSMNMDVLS